MTISVCMIVKNEEAVLARALDCVKEFADEIIIVDTGSNDNTKDIAYKFTDKVYDFEWADDFALARNFAFSLASGDYLFWLDADDVITKENINKIKALKASSSDIDTYMMKYATVFDEKGQPTFQFFRERMIRREKNPQWEGFIHEAIAPIGKVERVDICIEHHKVKRSDPKRNLRIYRKHLRSGVVFCAREQYYYSKELFYNGYFTKCIMNLKKFLKMPNKFIPNIYDAVFTLLRCYNNTGQYSKGISCGFNFLKHYVPNAEICCELAKLFVNTGDLECAIFYNKCALLCQPNIGNGSFVYSDYYYLVPYLQLVYLCYKLGDYQTAKYYHKLAKAKYPDHPSVVYNDKYFT